MDVHTWFGLTYSNYLVLNRTLLQGMPDEWQERFVAMMEELNEAIDGIPTASSFWVRATDGGRFVADPVPHYRRAPSLDQLRSKSGTGAP
jgi:hypothetical protein